MTTQHRQMTEILMYAPSQPVVAPCTAQEGKALVAWPGRSISRFRLRASCLDLVRSSVWILLREFGAGAVSNMLAKLWLQWRAAPLYPQAARQSLH